MNNQTNITKKLITVKVLAVLLIILLGITACQTSTTNKTFNDYETFEQVIADGKNQEVTIFMWGGNESINQYMDTFVADYMKNTYNVTLNRVPMNAPDYLAKLINEKKNNVADGSGDVLWINAENFRTAKEGRLLDGPFTHLLPNLDTYYDNNSSDLNYDSGILIEGYEGIWGKAQLVLTYDSAVVENPPKSFAELKNWVMDNPGKFTYPKVPDDFVGTAFVRSSYYELTGERNKFQEELDLETFKGLSEPVMDYFKEINPYLWQKGTTYPGTQSALDDLFKNGEVSMTMGFEVGKTAGQIASGVYPDTVKTYVFDTGTIGNSHYLAVPYNSPNKAAALLLIDFLQSPKAQLEKMKPEVWGDMPSFDVNLVSNKDKALLTSLEQGKGTIALKELTDHRLPEMKSKYIDWIKDIWIEEMDN